MALFFLKLINFFRYLKRQLFIRIFITSFISRQDIEFIFRAVRILNGGNMADLQKENQKLKQELDTIKTENKELKERLKKYTAPERGLNYYHKNKEKIAEYKKNTIKNRRAKKKKINQASAF